MTQPAARHYLDVLHDTFLLRQLTPWYSNTKKRLVRSPKVYIRDSGILHTILGIGTYADVVSHPVAGASFEGFVIEQIAALKPPEWEMSFYRSFSGAEIDLLLMPPGAAPIAVEITLSLSPVLQKGFHEAYQHSGCTRGYVIYPGDTRYPAAKNVETLPMQRLDALFAS